MACEFPSTVSFRTVLTITSMCLIAATAITTLSVTYVFSYAAAEAIARDHSLSLALKATGDIENFLNQPILTMTGLQYMFRRDSFPLPIDKEPGDPEWFRAWWQTFVSALAATSFKYQFAVAGFADGYYTGCKLLTTPNQFQCRAFSALKRASTNLSTSYSEDYWQSNYSLITNTSGTTKYDPRTRSWYHIPKHTESDMVWSGVYLSATPTLPIVDISASMFNGTGTFLGITGLTYELSQISQFLSNLVTTPNTKAILLDNDNVLLASTYSVPYLQQLPLPANVSEPLPPNCIASDVANLGQPVMLCRFSANTYPYSPLRSLMASFPGKVASGTSGSEKLTLSGETYYATVRSISTPKATGMGWRFVLLMPESDVIGGIIAGRNYAIIVTACILVASALLSFVVVRAILRPLDILAERMYETATLNDDDGASTVDLSVFDEMHTIQVAFNLLTTELKKVKSYLPQSVMAALYGDAADEDEDEEGPCGAGVTIAVVVETNVEGGGSAPPSRHGSVVAAHKRYGSNADAGESKLNLHAAGSRGRLTSFVDGKPAAQLNTALKLMQRKVTVLYVNICNFHAFARLATNDELLLVHAELLTMVCRLAKEAKGVLDGFQGDRFVLTFNAVTNVGNHACAAASCALAIIQHLLHDGPTKLQGVSMGLASGPCVVGNMGSSSVKKFSIIGHAFGQALVLERLCKKYSASVLLASQTIPDIENFYEHSIQDIVTLPSGAEGVPKRQFVSSLIAAKVVAADEWMYQLSEGQGASKFTAHNAAFSFFMRGETAQAKQNNTAAIERPQQEGETAEQYAAHRAPALHLQRLLNEDVGGASYSNSLSDYFTTCIADSSKVKVASG